MIELTMRQTPQKPARSFGMRRALFAASALASGALALDAASHGAAAQTVLLAPLGSHRAPSATVPVYAGADNGQDALSPLAVPPALSRPVSLAPGAALPAASPAPDISPSVNATADNLPVPSAAPAPSAAEPAPAPAPAPAVAVAQDLPTRAVPSRPVVLAQAAPLGRGDSQGTDALNSDELRRVAPAQSSQFAQPSQFAAPSPQPIRRVPTLQPGQATLFPGVPAPQPVAVSHARLPDELRYNSDSRDVGAFYRPSVPNADAANIPVDDGPLVPAARSTQRGAPLVVVDGSDAPRPAPYTGAGVIPAGAAPTGPAYGSDNFDPITQQINRSIVALRNSIAPSVDVAADYQGHLGQAGLSKLNTYSMPIETVFSPGGTGQVKLTITPTMLSAGKIAGNTANYQNFGEMALGLKVPSGSLAYTLPTYTGGLPTTQTAVGAGLDLRYTRGIVTADIGTTPLGFQQQNIIGGIVLSPALSDSTRLRVTAERRAVTESLLSYAGTTDPYSGKKWGGVTKSSGKIGVESTQGPWNLYAMGGAGVLNGQGVENNFYYEAGTGATYPVWKYDRQEIRLGLDLHYTAYDKNLSNFTYGQGGYFSPQRYITALIPVSFKDAFGRNLTYELDGSAGYAVTNEKAVVYFPTSAKLQSELEALTGDSFLNTSDPRTRTSGIIGGVSGHIDYRVSPNFTIGARGSFQNAGTYQQFGAALYGHYVFNGWYDK